jgi:hypothetical protein
MKQYERLLYQANIIPSRLALLFLVFNTWQTICTLNTVDVAAAGIRVMEIILLNILLSFAVFVTAFELKRYSLPWSWTGMGIGLFQCLRVFFIPPGPQASRINIAVSLLCAGALLIFASLWSLSKGKKYRLAKKEQVCHTSA